MKIARFRFTQAVTLVALTLCLAPHARATNLQSGLVAYWPFNDGSGTNLTDAAPADPTADNGTLRNSPTWLSGADGKFGAGLQFDSALSQDVALPVGGDLEPATNALTLSAWVKLDQLPSELTSSFSGIYDSQPDNFVMYLDKDPVEWLSCCGSYCDPCVQTIGRAVERAREVLGRPPWR